MQGDSEDTLINLEGISWVEIPLTGGGGGAGLITGSGGGAHYHYGEPGAIARDSITNILRGIRDLEKDIFTQDPVERAICLLDDILKSSKVDKGHGIEHALLVLRNTDCALEYIELPVETKIAIRLASLLHDADDRKFFPKGSSNATEILEKVLPEWSETQALALKMIDLVSCSKNGISQKGVEHEWMLYPRWSDRLESLGHTGILRAYQYTLHRKRHLDRDDTPRTNSKELLYLTLVTPERLEKYIQTKESATFIDHFYDKLLHLRKGFTTKNPFYTAEIKKRHQIMEDFVLEYGNRDVKEILTKYFSNPNNIDL